MIEGHRSYTLAADCEAEMQDWVAKLKAVIEQIKLQEEKRAASLERGKLEFRIIKNIFQYTNEKQ